MIMFRCAVLAGLAASTAMLFGQSLIMISGNGQVVQEQFQVEKPFVVRAVDAGGRGIPGVRVDWSVSPALTAGSLRLTTFTTDSEGYASTSFFASSNQPGISWTEATISASSNIGLVNFVLIVTLGRLPGGTSVSRPLVLIRTPQSGATLSGPAGSTLPGAIEVQLQAQGGIDLGRGVPNVGLRVEPIDPVPGSPTASCSGLAGITLSNQAGIATCDLVLGNVTGSVQLRAVVGEYWQNLNFTVNITPAVACTFSVSPTAPTFTSAGGGASINVSTGQNCSWTAVSSVPWITINGASSGQGSGIVNYAVAANPGSARTGALTIGCQTVIITQFASSAAGSSPIAFSILTNLPSATAGSSYSVALSAVGGTTPYRWASSGQLPAGLTVNPSTGVLSGVPATAGSFAFPVTVSDAAGFSATQTFTLNVTPPFGGTSSLSFAISSFPNATFGVPYSQAVSVTGGCVNPFSGPPQISVVSGSLPNGLSLQTLGSGAFGVGGTPALAGTYTFTLRATACGDSVTRDFTITVGVAGSVSVAPTALTFDHVTGVTSVSEQTIAVSGASPDASGTPFNVVAAAFNGSWLSVSQNSGVTPATIRVTANSAGLPAGTYDGSVTIGAPGNIAGTQVVRVTLRVSAPALATASPSILSFVYSGGAIPLVQTLSISSTTGAAVNFTSTAATFSGGNWLSVAPVSSSTPTAVTVSVNPSGVPVGAHLGTIAIQSENSRIPVVVSVNLTVTTPPPAVPIPVVSAVTNAASFAPGPISPGEFVTLFGSNLGPASLTTLRLNSAGMIETALSNTRVLFDGIPAPVIYTSANQVTVIVPYDIAGRALTRVQAEQSGILSTAFDVPVAESAPGIFTIAGTSQGAILNQDGSVNGPQAGAAPGSIISLFATGEGQTIPGGVAGSLVPATNLARPLLPVSLQIGGQLAEIIYAGSAPGLAAGVLQINARVPESAPRGEVPVVLVIGANASRTVTVSIR